MTHTFNLQTDMLSLKNRMMYHYSAKYVKTHIIKKKKKLRANLVVKMQRTHAVGNILIIIFFGPRMFCD